jgi:hypothetical protein
LSAEPLTKAFQNACKKAEAKTIKTSDKLIASHKVQLLRADRLKNCIHSNRAPQKDIVRTIVVNLAKVLNPSKVLMAR